jgi:bifunctional UDP-N-acetylglucosamine pyrophosphorylase/glucosamine-1-phosphate N-acetyltransferase
VRIGNYVEVKNSVLGEGVKADHLSYIGDADVGAGASFGCGSITVNYNWREKSRTVVGAGATIGCNVNLIAPVEIGRNSAVAAGSTITKAVPDDALAVARDRQHHVEGWAARRQGRAEAKTESPTGSAAGAPRAGRPGRKRSTGKKRAARKAGRGKPSKRR